MLAALFSTRIGHLDGTELKIAGMLLAYVAVTTLVCAAACASPTVRALKIEPQEALRVEG